MSTHVEPLLTNADLECLPDDGRSTIQYSSTPNLAYSLSFNLRSRANDPSKSIGVKVKR